MSRSRGLSESLKTPHHHPISLKVLRLSQPAFSAQSTLPKQSAGSVNLLDRRAALSCPVSQADETFFLSPLLNLPPSFGTVYVGETLCATVCANNEVQVDSGFLSPAIHVRLTAEIQIPSRKDFYPLELESATAAAATEAIPLETGDTLQRVLRFGLREEGNYVLAVTITCTEAQTAQEGQSPGSNGRERTLRKLYQFAAQQLLNVRTKTRTLQFGQGGHVLEAQLENLGDQAIYIESVTFNPKPPFTHRSLNAWDLSAGEEKDDNKDDYTTQPKLQPRNVLQVAFLLHAKGNEGSGPPAEDPRPTLGQMWIQWRGAMGERGSLNTGWLMGRRG